MKDLQKIQGLADDIINMILAGGCHKNEILKNAEEILELSEKLEILLQKNISE